MECHGVPFTSVTDYPVLTDPALIGARAPRPLPSDRWPAPELQVFLALSFLAWRAGVARYASTGS